MAPNKSRTLADIRSKSEKMTPAKKLKFDEKTQSLTQTPSCSWNSVRIFDQIWCLDTPSASRPMRRLTPPPTPTGGLAVYVRAAVHLP